MTDPIQDGTVILIWFVYYMYRNVAISGQGHFFVYGVLAVLRAIGLIQQ